MQCICVFDKQLFCTSFFGDGCNLHVLCVLSIWLQHFTGRRQQQQQQLIVGVWMITTCEEQEIHLLVPFPG